MDLDLEDDAIARDRLQHLAAIGAPRRRDHRPRLARLVSRLYASVGAPLRARMLAGLLRPLGPLGLAAIAAGAFAGFLQRAGQDGIRVALEDTGRYSSEQIFELARFVEQVSPQALQQVAGVVADNPAGVAAFSLSVALWILRALARDGPT